MREATQADHDATIVLDYFADLLDRVATRAREAIRLADRPTLAAKLRRLAEQVERCD